MYHSTRTVYIVLSESYSYTAYFVFTTIASVTEYRLFWICWSLIIFTSFFVHCFNC